jgi:pyrroloquinoline quinone biosynthesis protein D
VSAATDDLVPAFAAGVKFRHDAVRKAWVVLAPERLFLPDEQALEILHLVDGSRSLGAIVDTLVSRYQGAPREVIATDVAAMLRDLAEKNVLRLGSA